MKMRHRFDRVNEREMGNRMLTFDEMRWIISRRKRNEINARTCAQSSDLFD